MFKVSCCPDALRGFADSDKIRRNGWNGNLGRPGPRSGAFEPCRISQISDGKVQGGFEEMLVEGSANRDKESAGVLTQEVSSVDIHDEDAVFTIPRCNCVIPETVKAEIKCMLPIAWYDTKQCSSVQFYILHLGSCQWNTQRRPVLPAGYRTQEGPDHQDDLNPARHWSHKHYQQGHEAGPGCQMNKN